MKKKWPVLVKLLKDPSPLVRSSAASQLGGRLTPRNAPALAGGGRRSVAAGADTRRHGIGRAAAGVCAR